MAVELDPWGSIEVKLDEKMIEKFGLKPFSSEERKKLNHYLFERGVAVAHRDFELVIDRIVHKKPFIQLTGIASSGNMHLGHKIDVDLFLFFKSLGAKSHFVVSDIDAYISRPDEKIPTLEKAKEIAVDNIAHLLALGLDKKDIYVQSRKEPRYYEFAFEISKKITENTFRAIYGHLDPPKLAANLLQYSDILHYQLKEYYGPMPSITGIGIDQDPHARACRDIAKRLPYNLFPPSFIYFTHQPGLIEGQKMSSSKPETAIYLNDTPSEIKKKIARAYSGGRIGIEEHRKLGGVPEVDAAFQILRYHHPDSEFVQQVYTEYKSGKMLTGELKKICIEFLEKMLAEHQKKVEKNRKIAEEIVYGKSHSK